jgi:adenylate cyclase
MAKTGQPRRATLLRWLVLLPIPVVWAVLAQSGYLRGLENNLLDLRFRLRGEIPAPVKLVYVDVDTEAVEIIGERPWSRAIYADVAEVLLKLGGAKVVGFDFVMSKYGRSALVDEEKVKAGNAEFAKLIREFPHRIVLAAQYTPGTAVTQKDPDAIRDIPLLRKGKTKREQNDMPELPEPPIDGVARRIGLIDVDVEYSGDDVPRWVPLFVPTVGPTMLHMSLHLVLEMYGLTDPGAVQVVSDRLEIRRGETVLARVPLTEGQLLEANWFSRWESRHNPRYSVADIYSAVEELDSNKPDEVAAAQRIFDSLKDAIVLVGPVDPLLQDLAPTPFDAHPVPKVGLHGNLVKTIVSGQYLHRLPGWSTPLLIFGLTALVCGLALASGSRAVTRRTYFAPVVLIVYAGLGVVVFTWWQLVLPLAAPLGSASMGGFVAITWQLIAEQKAKGRIKGMFGTYLSPQLVDRMVDSGEDPQLGGHKENITAYFSDIQSFSTFSEVLDAGRLVDLLNEYLTACTTIVTEQGGTLDKYIGDAIVAMYGAPIKLDDHAFRACVATQLIHQRLAELRDKWKSEGDRWPELIWKMQTRIGLNTGEAVIGNMGSESRFNYTMMGDTVNIAARMESGAKSWGVYSMCTEATVEECRRFGGDRVVFRPLLRIKVKGRAQPLPIYEIVGLKENLSAQTHECLGIFAEGIARLYERDWDGAIARFQRSDALELNQPGKTPGVKLNASRALIEKVGELREIPDWDGVYEMTEK